MPTTTKITRASIRVKSFFLMAYHPTAVLLKDCKANAKRHDHSCIIASRIYLFVIINKMSLDA